MGVTFKWNKPTSQIIKETTGGDRAALFMASEARRFMNRFVPYEHGDLRDIVDVYTEYGYGIVHYKSPYAHRQYVGVGFKHTTTGTTAYWDKTMMQASRQDLVNSVQAFIRRGV